MYICVCFIWNQYNTSNIQYGVRIEAVFASLQQGEHTDRIQQFPAYIQASWSFYKFYKIEFSTKKRREKISKGRYQALLSLWIQCFLQRSIYNLQEIPALFLFQIILLQGNLFQELKLDVLQHYKWKQTSLSTQREKCIQKLNWAITGLLCLLMFKP